MPIYKGSTELTKIADFLTTAEHDITEVYFGDKQVFTVWATHDGALPATYNANGDYLADYRVYGAGGGVGDRTNNIYNTAETTWSYSNTIKDDDGAETRQGTSHYTTNFTPCKENTTYYISGTLSSGTANSYRVYFYDSSKTWINRTELKTISNRDFTTPSQCAFLQIQCYYQVTDTSDWEISEGSTAPAEYVPYGYEVDMSVSDGTTSTITPIYIGDTTLGEDEYVSFKEQKIYRMSGGVLTPTDPPVPLPAIPTVDGTNIVDYAGQSVAPARFVAKYRKEDF